MGLLEGKRAIVTGAGAGIGRAVAVRFVQEGAKVAVVDVDAAAAREVADELGELAVAIVADVCEEEQVERAVEESCRSLGGLDVVIGNAGVLLATRDDRADRLDLAAWQRTLDVNLTGMFLTCKHGIRALLATGGGAVVCSASPTGLYGLAPGRDAYSASKAGVYGLIRVLAADYAAERIRVNGVIPGFTDTPMNAYVDGSMRQQLVDSIPLGRQGTASEVAAVIAFLASDETSYVTGAVWAVDGGLTAV